MAAWQHASIRAKLRPCKLVPEGLKSATDCLEHVPEIREGNPKLLDALLTELKQAENTERKR